MRLVDLIAARGWRAVAGAVLMAALPVRTALGQWVPPYWQIHRAGLVDAEHTRQDGAQSSGASATNTAGQVVGISERYGSVGGKSAWSWTALGGTERIGLLDGEHTRSDGLQESQPQAYNSISPLSANGRVAGVSSRFAGTEDRGTSAWTWKSGEGTARVGYTDAAHTAADGRQASTVDMINGAGRVTGTSTRYAGLVEAGASAWTKGEGGTTTRLGFTDAAHTGGGGEQSSFASVMAESGQVCGVSARYGVQFSNSAWTWTEGGGTVRVGLTDAEHTGVAGEQFCSPFMQMNETGRVVGDSARYGGGARLGLSVWTWHQSEGTTRLGYTDALHTAPDGSQESYADKVTNSGRVMGRSYQLAGGAFGSTAWMWAPGGGTTRLGFVDAAHTNTGGNQTSSALGMNEAGQVIGTSERYTPGGTTGWVWTESAGTVRVGLTDAEHTGADGNQSSSPGIVNESGRVLGSSKRLLGGMNDRGLSAWTWTAAGGTVRTGLTDPVHTSSGGDQFNFSLGLNEAGHVTGIAVRFNGLDNVGQSGWFYDPATAMTWPLVFSLGNNGAANTVPALLTESGWVLGNYAIYAGDVVSSYNAFAWSVANGFTDLGGLVDGGLTANGWASLSSLVSAEEYQTIVGQGNVLGQTNNGSVFVLTVPGPTAGAVLGLAGLIAMGRRRVVSGK